MDTREDGRTPNETALKRHDHHLACMVRAAYNGHFSPMELADIPLPEAFRVMEEIGRIIDEINAARKGKS